MLPLTTQLLDDAAPLRFRLHARDRLENDSDVMLDQSRTSDNRRFQNELLTVLTDRELTEVENYWRIVRGLD